MSLCGELPPSKRVRTIDANGVEEFHEHNKWIHLDLKAAAASAAEDRAAEAQNGKHTEAAKQDADAEEAPDRMKPFEALFAARAELDVIVDLISNLQAGQLMVLQNVVPPPRPAHLAQETKFAELAATNIARLAPRQAQLRGAAARLRRGATALRLHCQQEASFYSQLVSLLRFWKVRLGPLGSDAPFYVDLSLEGQMAAGATAGGGSSAASSSSSSSSSGGARVDLIRDPEGQLRVQVEQASKQVPTLAVSQRSSSSSAAAGSSAPLVLLGPQAVHQHLLQQQDALVWSSIATTVNRDACSPNIAAFHGTLARMLLKSISPAGSTPDSTTDGPAAAGVPAVAGAKDPQLAAFRPLVLQQQLAALEQPAGGRAGAQAGVAPSQREPQLLPQLGLLEEIVVQLAHMSVRRLMRDELESQIARLLPDATAQTSSTDATAAAAARAPTVRMLTIAPTRPHTSAVRLEIEPPTSPTTTTSAAAAPSTSTSTTTNSGSSSSSSSSRRDFLVTVTESHVEVEGMLGQALGSRSARRSRASVRKQELCELLEDLLQGCGLA